MSGTDEPTAWEDINPGTALARRDGQLSEYSARLQPASPEQFRDELEACLALVVPVGMDENARAEWLAVAWQTLKHLPADLLSSGCAKARETCDHPSKIVPKIIAETAEWLEMRRSTPASAPMISAPRGPRSIGVLMDSPRGPMTEEETATLNAHLELLGSPARYRADGSKFTKG